MHNLFNFSLFLILLSLKSIALSFYDTNNPGLIKNTTTESFNTISDTIIALDITKEKIKAILQNSQKANNSQNASKHNRLQKKQSKVLINKKEMNEYNVFINYLTIQINDYCTIIYHKYGSDALLSLPCENEMTYSQLGTDKSSLTMNEQIESLDDELMDSLGTFDEMLLKEEEIIAMQSRKSKTSFESSSAMENNADSTVAEKSSDRKNNNKTDSGNPDEEESATNKELQEKDYSEKEKNSNASSKTKSKNQSIKNQNERRKLDKMDDDIVARQLKEAAEKEKDPALKKKLWDEYYKYKRNNIK